MSIIAAWIIPLACLAAQEPPTVRMNPGPAPHLERVSFDLIGLNPRQLATLRDSAPTSPLHPPFRFRVFREAPPPDGGRPEPERVVAGSYRVVGAVLRFTPAEPIGPPPRRYHVLLEVPSEPGARPSRSEIWFAPPRPAGTPE